MAEKNAIEVDTGRLEKVELSQLAVSPFNARKNAEVGPEDELVASIRAHGLLQPLVGYIAKTGPALVLVCAGQRRLLALRHIAKPETKIPVRIVDEETAIEVSLAENLERKDMNPVDEFAAFKALIDTGHYDADRIASRFGFSVNLVKRRLKMATLIPEILEAVREGAITIEAAEAYAAGSGEVQREVFKKHNAKGAWEPHKSNRVRDDIVISGLSANSRVGKFIGGMEAYKAAGGTVIDEAFHDLFKKDDDGRMRDVSIVRQLVEDRKTELADEIAALVKKKYPFATGYEWANLFGSYNVEMPKPAKKSGLVQVGNGWNSDAADTAKRAKKAAKEHDAAVLAIVALTDAGEPEVWPGKFLVGKEGWDQVKPEERSSSTYREPTPEERAAAARRQKIDQEAVRLAVAAMPDEQLAGMARTHGRIWGYHNGGGGFFDFRLEFKDEELKPYIEEATSIVDGGAEAKKADVAGFAATLEKLEALAIAEWPAVVVLALQEVDNCDLTISRVVIDGKPALWLLDEMSEGWSSDDAAHTVEVVRDQSEGWEPTLTIFETVEAYAEKSAGRCRLCGCVEECACVGSESDPDWHGPCAWADETKTLCSNPDCLAKAAVTISAPEAPAEPETVD